MLFHPKFLSIPSFRSSKGFPEPLVVCRWSNLQQISFQQTFLIWPPHEPIYVFCATSSFPSNSTSHNCLFPEETSPSSEPHSCWHNLVIYFILPQSSVSRLKSPDLLSHSIAFPVGLLWFFLTLISMPFYRGVCSYNPYSSCRNATDLHSDSAMRLSLLSSFSKIWFHVVFA